MRVGIACAYRRQWSIITQMSHDMTKQTKWVCAQRRLRSGHSPSLIRVFAVRMEKAWVLSYLLSAQRRLIWVSAGRTLILLVLSCRGSDVLRSFFGVLKLEGGGGRAGESIHTSLIPWWPKSSWKAKRKANWSRSSSFTVGQSPTQLDWLQSFLFLFFITKKKSKLIQQTFFSTKET